MYLIEGQVATLTTSRINDGLWHRIEIVWLAGGGVRLSLDYEKRVVTKMLNAKVQGLYMGKITLGNLEDSEVDNVKIIPFRGCIQVRIFMFILIWWNKLKLKIFLIVIFSRFQCS